MTFSVQILRGEGEDIATLIGTPKAHATAPTGDAAPAAVEQFIARGELVTLESGRRGLARLAGGFRDDAALKEIFVEAYRLRNW